MERAVGGVRQAGTVCPGWSLGAHLRQVAAASAAVPAERTLQRILEMAVKEEGAGTPVCESRWLAFLDATLQRGSSGVPVDDESDDDGLHVATVHAIKGLEFPHVVVYEYNLFGHRITDMEHPQEHNLLYIALTRSTSRLTLLLNRRTHRVPSPYLPVELVHHARDLWQSVTHE
jgi:superfamily I DNA/RNA helicase